MKARPIIVLFSICLLIAALLAVVNGVTVPAIEKNAEAKRQAALKAVMPNVEKFEELGTEGLPDTVKYAYRDAAGTGYVFVLSTTSIYSSDPMGITVAINNEGKITGIVLTSYFETKDFGKNTYPQSYVGKDQALDGIDTVSGVTYSSTAFKNAVKDAFTAFKAVAQ